MRKLVQMVFLIWGLSALSLSAIPPVLASEPYGMWSKGNVTVKVSQCGSKLCGNIVALQPSRARFDVNNADSSKRNRSLIGLSVLIEMKPIGKDGWEGFIYNPIDGQTYAATLKFSGDTLFVKGCVTSGFCSTNKFARK